MIKTNLKKEPAPRRDPIVTIRPMRRDGKFPVTYHYPGEPNLFGGYDHGKTFSKLRTAEQIIESLREWYVVKDNSLGTYEAALRRGQ